MSATATSQHEATGAVPDPFAVLGAGGARLRGGLALARQRERRDVILATTRRVLAETPDRFTLRRVAESAGVSTETVRNAFGRREDLLVAAFNDHTSAVWRGLAQRSRGPTMFLDLARIYHGCALAHPLFLRSMVCAAMAEARPLATAQRHGSAIKLAHLREMERGAMLRPGVDVAALAGQVTRLNTAIMYDWARGLLDDDALLTQMVEGTRMLLLGALAPQHGAEVEAWRAG